MNCTSICKGNKGFMRSQAVTKCECVAEGVEIMMCYTTVNKI